MPPGRAGVPFIRLQPGREYLIRWSACLSPDFQFDSQQLEGIGQMLEGAAQGSPPWGMSLARGRYEVQSRDAGSAAPDRGHRVRRTLHYRPDAGGADAIMELDMDGARSLSRVDCVIGSRLD